MAQEPEIVDLTGEEDAPPELKHNDRSEPTDLAGKEDAPAENEHKAPIETIDLTNDDESPRPEQTGLQTLQQLSKTTLPGLFMSPNFNTLPGLAPNNLAGLFTAPQPAVYVRGTSRAASAKPALRHQLKVERRETLARQASLDPVPAVQRTEWTREYVKQQFMAVIDQMNAEEYGEFLGYAIEKGHMPREAYAGIDRAVTSQPEENVENLRQSPARQVEELVVYSDGSLKRGFGGCGVTVRRNGVWTDRAVALGPVRQSNDTELYGISEALHLIDNIAESGRALVMTDSMGSIQKLQKVRRSGATDSSVVRRIISAEKMLLKRGISVRYQWVKGHSGVQGNVRADRLAGYASEMAKAGYVRTFNNPNIRL